MKDAGFEYDAVIVGGGVAGLACGLILSRAGRRVVLLEKNRRLGGYAVSYTLRGHRYDAAVQSLGGCAPGGAVYELLQEAGLEDRIDFLSCDPARVYWFDDDPAPWIQPARLDLWKRKLARQFPLQADAIRRCYRIWGGIMQELEQIAVSPGGGSLFGFSRQYPLLAQYSGHDLKRFLEELNLPPLLQRLLCARSGYCMLPLERLSAVAFACTEMTYRDGSWLTAGGIQRLIALLAGALLESGGRIERRAALKAITTRKGRVTAAVTADGRTFSAPAVISAAFAGCEPRRYLDDPALLPERHYRRLKQMEPSGSYYIAYYSIPAQAAAGLWPNMEIDTTVSEGSPAVYYLMIPSLVDPSAAPPGRHAVCLSLPIHGLVGGGTAQADRMARGRWRRMVQQAVEQRFPDLARRLEFLFDLGPKQLEAVSGNPGGSAYGWAQLPEQSGIRRLNVKTPVKGLYLAGHWTMPGGGIPGAVASARLCARALLDADSTH